MAFWKPGTAAPGIDLDRDSEDGSQGGLSYVYNKFGNLSLQQQRVNLPIFRFSTFYLCLITLSFIITIYSIILTFIT